MTSLAVTEKGQVTLEHDVLQHLGIKPGERIELNKLPGGELRIKASRPTNSIDGFIGLLAGKSKTVLSIEEINAITTAGWAGQQ